MQPLRETPGPRQTGNRSHLLRSAERALPECPCKSASHPLHLRAYGPYRPFRQATDAMRFKGLQHTSAYRSPPTPAHWSFR